MRLRWVIMMRWGLTAAAAVLLIAWVLSGGFYAEFHHKGAQSWGVTAWGGVIAIYEINPPQSPGWTGLAVGRSPDSWMWRSDFVCGVDPIFQQNRELLFPIWWPLVVVAVPALATWSGHVLKVRRSKKAMCRSCGYDRRGLAADAKCPECGKPPRSPP